MMLTIIWFKLLSAFSVSCQQLLPLVTYKKMVSCEYLEKELMDLDEILYIKYDINILLWTITRHFSSVFNRVTAHALGQNVVFFQYHENEIMGLDWNFIYWSILFFRYIVFSGLFNKQQFCGLGRKPITVYPESNIYTYIQGIKLLLTFYLLFLHTKPLLKRSAHGSWWAIVVSQCQ